MTGGWTSLAIAAGVAVGLSALITKPPAAPFVVNESASLPRGLYRHTAEPVARGRIVMLPPPPMAGTYLAGLGAGPGARLLKRVAAVGGETVCARGERLSWPHGVAVALSRDRRGRRLLAWRGCRRLAADELLVVGDTPTSFDSRYFGPVRTAAVEGVYREVWRW